MKQNKIIVIGFLVIIAIPAVLGQTIGSLTMKWEASVKFAASGQRTVVVNDTLWHFGGYSDYGIPYGEHYWDRSFMEYWAPGETYWQVAPTTIEYRADITAESYGGNIYIFGGNWDGSVDAVEIFNPATRTMTYGTAQPNPGRYSGSALHNGKIYIIGGNTPDGNLDRVDIYDIASNSWSVGAPLPIATSTEAVYYDGKIYTMGGYDGTVRNEIFEYNIAANSWSQIGTTPAPVSAHEMEVYQGEIFVIGDYVTLDVVWSYNISNQSWTDYTTNFIGRRHASSVIYNDKLYIVSGNSQRDGEFQYFNIVQSIDLAGVVSTTGESNYTPKTFGLEQNYPNPFNPITNIDYSLEQAGDVSLIVHDLLGKEVRTLVSGHRAKGNHTVQWDGKSTSGHVLSTGEYLVVIEMEGQTISKKVLMLK